MGVGLSESAAAVVVVAAVLVVIVVVVVQITISSLHDDLMIFTLFKEVMIRLSQKGTDINLIFVVLFLAVCVVHSIIHLRIEAGISTVSGQG